MSPAKAGVLVGLFVLLLAVYFGLEWRSRQAAERVAKARRLFDVAPDSLTGVRLDRPDAPTIRLAKSADGRWRIVEPQELAADQDAARRLVQSVAEATRERALEGVDPAAAQYGLATPAATVTLEAPSGSQRLVLGADAPVGGAAYARRGDDPAVVLVPAAVKADAIQSLFDLRDKRVVEVATDRVRRVEVRASSARSKPIALVKDGAQWRLEGAPAARAVDQGKAERLVDAALGMRMTEVLSEERSGAGKRGLAPAARLVAIRLESGPGPTIAIGSTVDQKGTAVAVEGEPGVYLVDTASIAPLAWRLDELLAPPSP